MDNIRQLFREMIAKFMEYGLEAELDEELGCSRQDHQESSIFYSLSVCQSDT